MMQAIRTRAGSIVVKVLFGLLIISFGFWGIYTRSDYYQGHSPETVIATVGDDSIRAQDLQGSVQAALERMRAQFGSELQAAQLKQFGILDTLLNQLIDRDLLDQEAGRLGLDVSDDLVRRSIFENPAFKGPDGQFNRVLYQQALAMRQLTEDQLVARLRREIPRGQLVEAITTGVVAPRPVVDVLYRYRNEKRIAAIVMLPLSGAPDPGQPSEADLTAFYEAHQDLFRAPEYRSFTVASLAPADIQPRAQIPEATLRKEYEQRKEEYETPEQREVQQILAPSEEKAKEVAAALAAGKDWKEVAQSIAGQAPDTVDLGMFSRKDLPPELANVVFDLPLNEASQPVKTPLGWHILRVTKIEPPKTQTYEEAKPQIEAELQQQDAVEKIDKIATQADDAIAGGMSLADVAAKYGLKLTTVAAADNSGNDPNGQPVALPLSASDIVKTAFAAEPNQTDRVTETADGAIFVVRVEKIVPPQVRPLAEVKDKAVQAWQADKKRDAVMKQAEALAAAVKPDLPLDKAAAERGLSATPSKPFGRAADAAAGVSPLLVSKLFAAKQGDVVTAADQTGAMVAQLTEIQIPENPAEAAVAGLSDQIAGEQRLDIATEFTESLRQRFPVEIKRDALNRMF